MSPSDPAPPDFSPIILPVSAGACWLGPRAPAGSSSFLLSAGPSTSAARFYCEWTLANWSDGSERGWGACVCLQGRALYIILKQRSGPLRQARRVRWNLGIQGLFNCISPDSPIHFNRGSDLGVANLWSLSSASSGTLLHKTSPGPNPQLMFSCRRWGSPLMLPSSLSGFHI